MLGQLTVRLGQLSLRQGPYQIKTCALRQLPVVTTTSSRSFASKKAAKPGPKDEKKKPAESAALQHEQWVKFQKAIHVDGFETGQTMVAKVAKKGRGGRKKASKRQEALQAKLDEDRRFTDVGGGKFPPLRYSPEETDRLLQLAYAAIPKRAAQHRATRKRKRQATRWKLVRKIRAKQKHYLKLHQERKMEKRSLKVKSVKEVLAEAPHIVQSDREYQLANLKRWAETMRPSDTTTSSASSAIP